MPRPRKGSSGCGADDHCASPGGYPGVERAGGMQGGDARSRRVLARAWWQRGDPVRPAPRPEPGTRRTRPRGPASPRRGRRWTRWRAGCRGGVAPPARGWSRGDGLGASSRPVLLRPGPRPSAREGARPRVPWRHQRRPGHDVRQGVDASGLLRQVGAAAMRPPLGSRATGSRRGAGGPPLPWACQPACGPPGFASGPWRGPQPTGSPVSPGRMVPPLVHSPTSPASRGPALTGRPQRLGDGTHARRARSPERVRACTAPPASAHGAMTGRRT